MSGVFLNQSSKLRKKIDKTREFVSKVLDTHENPVVACSFGKNSITLLHMILQLRHDVTVLFVNTLVHYPETYRFKKLITKKWNLSIIEAKPNRSFWWVVENYGFPLYGRKGYRSAGKSCCLYLKEYPADKIFRKYKFDLEFTGLSRHESRMREFAARRYGNYFYSKRKKHWKCHPLQDWTNEDIWGYHRMHNVPHNELYDKEVPEGYDLRSGCWPCTIPIRYGKVEFLRMNYPKMWNFLLKKGLAKLMVEMKTGLKVSEYKALGLIEERPCYFDKI